MLFGKVVGFENTWKRLQFERWVKGFVNTLREMSGKYLQGTLAKTCLLDLHN